MSTSIHFRWIGVLFYVMTLVGLWGQTSTPASPSSQNQSTLQAFQQEQQTLGQEMQALMAQGATQAQLTAWQQQHAAELAAQQQRAQAMATASALEPSPTNGQPNIPADASQTLKDFLTTRAALANARAQIHNQLVQSMSPTATAGQVSQMQQQEIQTFQQQNAQALQLQTQRMQTLANESASTPLTVPGPTVIPPGATPQMATYLTQRDQLRRGWIQLWNQNINADPSVRGAALQQWQQQNAGLIQQLQQQAQSLAQANSTTQN